MIIMGSAHDNIEWIIKSIITLKKLINTYIIKFMFFKIINRKITILMIVTHEHMNSL